MGKVAGFALIGTGSMMLLNIIIMAIGGMEVMVGLILPSALHMVPVNQQLLAWVDIPLSMALEAELSNVRTFKEKGIIGGGMMDFQVTLAGGGADSAEVPTVAALYIQEEAEIDEVQRYYLDAGPLNYPSIFFWLVSMGSLGVLGVSIAMRLMGGKKSGGGIERGSSAPPGTTIQVIALDETAFKD